MKIMLSAVVLMVSANFALAGDTPKTPEKSTIPGTGGYMWRSGPPDSGANRPPATGGSVGVQYPPDKGPTKVKCTRDGKEVAC
jgi:hypothetical protein